MQPSRLNLLSKEKKHHLQQLVYVQFSKRMLEIVLFILCVFGVALIGSEQLLQTYVQSITRQSSPNIQQLESINNSVSYINNTVLQTETIQKLSTQWTDLMRTIAINTPTDITLTSLRMTQSTKTLILNGQATNRDALLTFQQSLESIDWIDTAIIPLSQLTEKNQIPFSITATLK
jgi:hypothetical protein